MEWRFNPDPLPCAAEEVFDYPRHAVFTKIRCHGVQHIQFAPAFETGFRQSVQPCLVRQSRQHPFVLIHRILDHGSLRFCRLIRRVCVFQRCHTTQGDGSSDTCADIMECRGLASNALEPTVRYAATIHLWHMAAMRPYYGRLIVWLQRQGIDPGFDCGS